MARAPFVARRPSGTGDGGAIGGEGVASLALPARLVEEALAQDDQHLRVDECAPGGSADYAEAARSFEVSRIGASLAPQLDSGARFARQGVLPEVQRLWRSFDARLLLWPYLEGPGAEVVEYRGVTQDIVGVMVARPKDFVVGVDYFLVIATLVEVSLHSLCFAPGGRLLPPARTQHSVATDDVVVSAMASDAKTGRIFLGGVDGCIHELQYFDDEGGLLGRPRKCRKTTINWNLQSRLPTLLRKASEALFGCAEGVAQLLVDSDRGFLFSLSSASSITVFHLPSSHASVGQAEELGLTQMCCISQAALASDVARAHGQLFPNLASVPCRASAGAFPGGNALSAAAVARPLNVVKLLAFERAYGGSIVACAVTGDGTRIFLRGVARPSDPFAGPGGSGSQPLITGLAVHHVRFPEPSGPPLRVRDAVRLAGATLLMGALGGEDVIVAISTDLRAVAQRQSRGRSPWLSPPSGFAEQAEVLRLGEAPGEGERVCEVIALSPITGLLPQPIEGLYGGPARGTVLPVLGLSELAQQQLLPPPRCALISSLGVHVLARLQPLDLFRSHVLQGDMAALQEFALQYTPEQTSALCFQVLTAVAPRLRQSDGQGRAGTGLRAHFWGVPRSDGRSGAGTAERDATGDLVLLRTEHLLLAQPLPTQLGLVQTWPCIEAPSPWAPSSFGHSIQARGARIDGRLRGLCLYLSRILRPMWLAPVVSVSWPSRAEAPKKKRRSSEWWPPPEATQRAVSGSKWSCAWSRAQRSYVQGQLQRLSAVLERCRGQLAPEEGVAARPASGDAAFGAELVGGIALLIGTAVEGLNLLELVAASTDAFGAGLCPAEILVPFAELTFRDLVCRSEARAVLQQLMRGGALACQQLHARCPRLFSSVDLEVQQSYELLMAMASSRASGADPGRLAQLLQQPLRSLERHAARVQLGEAASRLRAVGACKGLVALCARIARVRDPRDECLRPRDPASAQTQQLHYARLECYQVVLEVFEDLFLLAQGYAGGAPGLLGVSATAAPGTLAATRGLELPALLPMPLHAADALPILDALLRHCLEDHVYGADELFHFCILKWMMQRDLPLYRYESPYLRSFLERHARDQPELLCRYHQHRRQWAEACDAYMALANRLPQREERLPLLQAALLCARMPGTGQREQPILRAIAETRAPEALVPSGHG